MSARLSQLCRIKIEIVFLFQDAERRQQAKEEAIVKHKREKLHRHKLLAKRNYKGQPNMSSRMELLLEQIVKRQQKNT